MNDESKKLKRFEKEFALVKHSYGKCDPTRDKLLVRNGWIGGFEEMLKIVDESRRSENHSTRNPLTISDVISYINRAIRDELGAADDETAKPVEPQPDTNSANIINKSKSDFIKQLEKVSKFVETRPDWEQHILGAASRSPYDVDYCDCRFDESCDVGMKSMAKCGTNLERIERLKSRDQVLAEARKKAAEHALDAMPLAARKFYGVAIRDGRVGFEKKYKQPICARDLYFEGDENICDNTQCDFSRGAFNSEMDFCSHTCLKLNRETEKQINRETADNNEL